MILNFGVLEQPGELEADHVIGESLLVVEELSLASFVA
jgi:hypothetical protein